MLSGPGRRGTWTRGVATFVVALHRQPGELHGVPLQRRGVHGAKARHRRREGGKT